MVPILGRKQTINRKMNNDRQIPKTLAGALGGEQIGNVIAVSIRKRHHRAFSKASTQLKLREIDILSNWNPVESFLSRDRSVSAKERRISVGSAVSHLEFLAPANEGEAILWLSASLAANFCETQTSKVW